MANQIRLNKSNNKRMDAVLEHTKKDSLLSNQTKTSIANLAIGFGMVRVEEMVGLKKTKKQ